MIRDLQFIKSSFSNGGGNCVAVAKLPDGGRAVRDTKDPDPVQVYAAEEWTAFIGAVRAGEFD